MEYIESRNISPEIKENRGQTNPSGAVTGENKW